ncbi:HNH endonuclease [Rhizobium setariae]|nr:HNH endonuclease [Rhizobium setariae]
MIEPRVCAVKPRIGRAPGEKARDRERERTQHWRKWYHSAEWKVLRMLVLIRDRFTCQMCGKVDGNTSRLIGDHKEPHHGDRAMFFNEDNVWCICKPCHDGDKQRMERGALLSR